MLLSDVLPASLSWRPVVGDLVLLGVTSDDLLLAEALLDTLPAKARGQVFVEAERAADVRSVAAPGRVCVTWLLRERGQSLRTAVDAWLEEMLPIEAEREHRVHAWISGEPNARTLVT